MATGSTLTNPIAVGAEVWGRDDDQLGTIARVIVDPHDDRITDIVVKRGTLMSSEYVVPLSWFSQRGEHLSLAMTSETLEALPEFSQERFRAPDPDYTGPPGFDAASAGRANMQLDTVVAFGPLGAIGTAAPVYGFPGGESVERRETARDEVSRPTISEGDDVLDCNGEKIGSVGEFVTGLDGYPRSMSVKQGMIFKSEMEIPSGWIAELSDKGVVLTVSRETVERMHSDD